MCRTRRSKNVVHGSLVEVLGKNVVQSFRTSIEPVSSALTMDFVILCHSKCRTRVLYDAFGCHCVVHGVSFVPYSVVQVTPPLCRTMDSVVSYKKVGEVSYNGVIGVVQVLLWWDLGCRTTHGSCHLYSKGKRCMKEMTVSEVSHNNKRHERAKWRKFVLSEMNGDALSPYPLASEDVGPIGVESRN